MIEVALAVMLVIGAGLLIRTVYNLSAIDAGFDRARLVTFAISLPGANYPSGPPRVQMYQRLLVDRNKAWLPKIEALFSRSGHAIVVVGAAHLVGPDGVVAMLKAKGYTVEQL